MNEIMVNEENIKAKIYTVRGLQVMLDSDLAELYGVETKVFNQAVKRNEKRFPNDFRFRLTQTEYQNLRSQIVTSSFISHGGARYLPYVFTEQGVSMLSAVLKSDIAVDISVNIIRAFVNMRKFISNNALIFQRLESLENKQSKNDEKFNKLFEALEDKTIKPKQGIFYDGEVFDAYRFVADLIRSAKNKIILIDNYVDDSVLTLFSKNQNIDVVIYTQTISKQLTLDIEKYNSQYKAIEIKSFKYSHDRFMIIDDVNIYHIGASLKDLGKKWFAFSKLDIESFGILGRLEIK
jgi:hypothetical protein